MRGNYWCFLFCVLGVQSHCPFLCGLSFSYHFTGAFTYVDSNLLSAVHVTVVSPFGGLCVPPTGCKLFGSCPWGSCPLGCVVHAQECVWSNSIKCSSLFLCSWSCSPSDFQICFYQMPRSFLTFPGWVPSDPTGLACHACQATTPRNRGRVLFLYI